MIILRLCGIGVFELGVGQGSDQPVLFKDIISLTVLMKSICLAEIVWLNIITK
jgi:hypothetical protein